MYSIFIQSRKVQKTLDEYIRSRSDIGEKLDRLRLDSRRANGAHPLHGKLEGKWSCWLGSDIRLVYILDDKNQRIIIQIVGSHKVY